MSVYSYLAQYVLRGYIEDLSPTHPHNAPKKAVECDYCIVLGMGGSGIIGKYLRALVQERWGRPVFTFDYGDTPPPTTGRYLLIAVSYSGATAETIEAFKAFAKKAAAIGVVSGRGELAELALSHGAALVEVGGSPAPRFGLAKMLSASVSLFAELTGESWALSELAHTRGELDSLITQKTLQAAENLARFLAQATPIVYSSGHLAPVGYRWKTQFNENAKIHAFHSSLPEANHNEVNAKPSESFRGVMLLSHRYPEVVRKSYRAYEEVAGMSFSEVWARGSAALSEMMYATIYGDYASIILAKTLGVDPLRVEAIAKAKAAQKGVLSHKG